MNMDDLQNSFPEELISLVNGLSVAYVDIPIYKNCGDILIFLGTMEFLRNTNTNVSKIMATLDLSDAHVKSISKESTIICQGGGNFGDIYERNNLLREAVVKGAKQSKIAILPQSIQYADENKLENVSAIMRSHPDLTIFTRDIPSFELSKTHFSDKTYLSQDMAHALYDWLAPVRAKRPRVEGASSRTLYFIRDDKEGGVDSMPTVLSGSFGPLDWPQILRLREKIVIEGFRKAAQASRIMPALPLSVLHAYESVCRRLMLRMAHEFIQYDHIVTSRLHGAIFGLLLDRKVTILDNSYGKNSRYYDSWLKDIPHVDVQLRSDKQSVGYRKPAS